jgi:hypothetical protein
MKKLTMLIPVLFSLPFCVTSYGQQPPPGVLVQTIDCSLNEGASMADALRWARALPRDGNSPDAVFFREAIYNNNFRENYDFRIASYYPSYTELNRRMEANQARPDVRPRPGQRGSDLFTCNPATLALALNRGIPDGDAFTGDYTMMTTRFCRLNEGRTLDDAWAFVQGVANNFRAVGDTSLMQMYNRAYAPVQDAVAGNAFVIASVPATSAAWAARSDRTREGFNPIEGLELPASCNYPALWRTNAVHRSAANN